MKTNEQIRVESRGKLQGQWLMVVLILLAAGIVGRVIQRVFDQALGFPENSWQESSLLFLLNVLLLFAFEFGSNYVGLVVARGGKAKVDHLFAVFNGQYYFSMMGINFVQAVILKIAELLIMLPLLVIGGVSFFWGVINLGNNSEFDWLSTIGGGLTVLMILGIVALVVALIFVQTIIGGAIQFVMYTKFDQPQLTIGEAFQEGWRLYRPHIKQYIWLELSMIPYLLAGLVVFCIGIYWSLAWLTVAEADFYDAAKAAEMTDF